MQHFPRVVTNEIRSFGGGGETDFIEISTKEGENFLFAQNMKIGAQKAVMQTILEATTLDHVAIECGTPYSQKMPKTNLKSSNPQ